MFITNQHRGKKGFTLIELLVVVAIIVLLAAILFPVFTMARDKARQSACSSNMKQLGLGILQYMQDYDGVYGGGYTTVMGVNHAKKVSAGLTPFLSTAKQSGPPSPNCAVADGANQASCAEGVDYKGADKHQATASFR